MELGRERKYFLFTIGAIGLEAMSITVYLGLYNLIKEHECDPIILFITKPSNETLMLLIKRKLGELGIKYKDLNGYSGIKNIRRNVFSNLLTFGAPVTDCAYSIGSTKRYMDNFFNTKSLRDKYKYIVTPLNPIEFDYMGNVKANLRFSDEENERGKSELKKMGFDGNSDYVCVHARDGAYVEALGDVYKRNNDEARNSSFLTYLLACEYLSEKSIASFRMGALQSVIGKSIFSKNIINYSELYRSDFMDVWLMSKAKFIVGNSSGLNMLCYLFGDGVPLIWADAGAILSSTPWSKKDIYIPQRLWLKDEKRFLTFQEISERNIGYSFDSYLYEKNGVEVVKSSEYDILEATKEMNGVLGGNYIYSEEDDFLLQKWRDAFLINQAPKHTPARVSLSFLRENKSLYLK